MNAPLWPAPWPRRGVLVAFGSGDPVNEGLAAAGRRVRMAWDNRESGAPLLEEGRQPMSDKPTTTLTVDADELQLLLTATQELLSGADRHGHSIDRLHRVITKLQTAEWDLGQAEGVMAQDAELVQRFVQWLIEKPEAAGQILAEMQARLDARDRTFVITRWVWSLQAKYPNTKTPGEALRREGVDPEMIRPHFPA